MQTIAKQRDLMMKTIKLLLSLVIFTALSGSLQAFEYKKNALEALKPTGNSIAFVVSMFAGFAAGSFVHSKIETKNVYYIYEGNKLKKVTKEEFDKSECKEKYTGTKSPSKPTLLNTTAGIITGLATCYGLNFLVDLGVTAIKNKIK